jgi:hypothetical protein
MGGEAGLVSAVINWRLSGHQLGLAEQGIPCLSLTLKPAGKPTSLDLFHCLAELGTKVRRHQRRKETQ